MEPEKNDKLDELLFEALKHESPEFDFDKWQTQHQTEIEIFKSQTANRHILQPAGFWRTIMKSKITKLAAAAVIIVTIGLLAYHHTGSIDGTSVAWADVFKNVEASNTVVAHVHGIFKNTLSKYFTTETDGTFYFSSDYGSWMDVNSVNDENSTGHAIVYWEDANGINPKNIIKDFKTRKFTRLGRSVIDGVEVEGIEVKDPNLFGETFAHYNFDEETGRLWVNVTTDMPVRIEVEGSTKNQKRQLLMVLSDIRWNQDVHAALEEYKQMYTKRPKLSDPNETVAIEGLRFFASVSEGRYPTDMKVETVRTESSNALRAHKANLTIEQREEFKKAMREHGRGWAAQVTAISFFYRELVWKEKEPMYYGDKVTAADSNMLLMRWKISDGQYRVVYGDLHTEEVTPEKLAELEKSVK